MGKWYDTGKPAEAPEAACSHRTERKVKDTPENTRIWTTLEKEEIPICKLGDRHLLNIISLLRRRFRKWASRLEYLTDEQLYERCQEFVKVYCEMCLEAKQRELELPWDFGPYLGTLMETAPKLKEHLKPINIVSIYNEPGIGSKVWRDKEDDYFEYILGSEIM